MYTMWSLYFVFIHMLDVPKRKEGEREEFEMIQAKITNKHSYTKYFFRL